MVDIKKLIQIAEQAGHRILSIYNQPSFEITQKADHSVLTKADLESHHFICDALKRLYPSVPIISEESADQYDYDERKHWESFFLVDPLDGTKEFIQRNGEFTINIALIQNNQPILGVVHAPALGLMYYAERDKGAYKIINNESIQLPLSSITNNQIRVVMSRSHCCSETKNFLITLENQEKEIVAISAGSALKFGLIAEGYADIYPRFAPTMEWDTAAGQVLVNEVGKQVMLTDGSQPLQYNKQQLLNPGFIVQ